MKKYIIKIVKTAKFIKIGKIAKICYEKPFLSLVLCYGFVKTSGNKKNINREKNLKIKKI